MRPSPSPTIEDELLTASRLGEIERRLHAAITGEVSVETGRRALYTSDSSNYRLLPAAIVAPRSPDDLEATVGVARELGLGITMRGAGTSVAGNAIGRGIIVDTTRHLNSILGLDPVARIAVVQPGVVLDELNRSAAPHGLRFGPDPSTHSRCTVGGMVGNDACGAHSVLWGTTADNTLGLDVITAAGRSVSLGATGPRTVGPPAPTVEPDLEGRLRRFVEARTGLIRRELPPWPRRVSGYALDWLLPERGFDVARSIVGSEGTCAIVSAATLRLVRPPAARVLLVVGFPDDITSASAVGALLPEGPLTVESMSRELLGPAGGAAELLPIGDAWLLIEAGGDSSAEAATHAARMIAAFGLRASDPSIALVTDAVAQRELWRIREDGAGRASRLPDGSPAWPGFEDAAVAPARLPAFLADLRALLHEHGLRGTPYGHFGEGCIHLRVGFGLDRPEGVERLGSFMSAAADLVVSHGGTLSGEHGDGRARSELLPRMFGPDLMRAFAEYKAIWDPDGLLNPGVLVEPDPITASLRRPRPTMVGGPAGFAFERDGDFRAAVERCIGVGKCVSREGTALMCPSFRATGDEEDSTRGRARLLQEMLAGSLATEGWRSVAVRDALDLCLACKGCASDCPTGVDMASYKSVFLDRHYRGRLRPRSHYSLGWLPTWLHLARRIPRLVNAAVRVSVLRQAFGWLAGMAPERTIPPLARMTFVRAYGRARRTEAPTRARGRVVLWPDTFNNHLTPEVAHAAVRVLSAASFEVVVPSGRACCGLTWITTGQLDHARAIIRRTLAAPELAGEEPIVVLEPSCAAALRSDLVELLPGDPRARSVARRVTTLAELLDEIALPGSDAAMTVDLVQPHCHAQAVLGTDADTRLMAGAGIAAERVLTGCCGLAGNFGAEAGHERVSRAVADLELAPALAALDPDALVLADGFSCRTQIAFLSGRRARHLAEVLADRLENIDGATPGTLALADRSRPLRQRPR